MAIYPVILCGGAGTRLWPASRPSRPKQFIDLVSDLSLFQETVRRIAPLAEAGRIVVVAGHEHRQYVENQLAALGVDGDLILEPAGRDSAPAMAAAALWVERIDPDATAVFVASDHYIPDAGAFRQAAVDAVAAAAPGRIVTLGMTPASPSSAYGYIQPRGTGLAPVGRFVEKPGRADAERYLEEGYLWNSGNFVAPVRTLLAEMKTFVPDVVAAVGAALPDPGQGRVHILGPAFAAATKISIDYAVMERSDKVWVLPAFFEWSDLGAWDAVAATGSGARGDWIGHASEGCLVRAAPGMVVATAGVSNLAIIVEPDAVLVCDLDHAQDVKALVEELGRREPRGGGGIAGDDVTLNQLSRQFTRWLKLSALPLWATLGVGADGGFVETLDDDGATTGDFRRARVQARQAFVFSLASEWGWGGDYAPIVQRGLARFEATNLRSDGLYRTRVDGSGAVLDETASLYDQAFVLLATAAAAAAGIDPDRCRRTAARLLASLDVLALPQGGWRELAGPPFQANAHMHLLEAALAWEALEPDGAWTAIADVIVGMAKAHFIDEAGFLREFFGPDWRPDGGEAGRLVEPGHQFEWAWLLTRWGRLRGDRWAVETAKRLFASGERGLDPARGVAIDELDDHLRPRSSRARLWPQTEWLKAALILAEETDGDEQGRLLGSAASALRGLTLYLRPEGLWRDKLGVDGVLDIEPAPASSLYHIVAAYRQLRETGSVLPGSGIETPAPSPA
ncbi:AGE family epimerase/isomerase [Brevundimonas sp.]|uniref:AGE family epimerase/isomerase n=1 Tax=Brevundimonas sp. TaxID=1871086 RepID=UPI002737A37F|nr:AGE family epimerase/isomerase [Brevundimonas sp.]MDP3803007.1 AGE family epimerase/isomerase [Brevundimonas sp.]